MRYDVYRKEIGKSNSDVEIFLLMLYHFFHVSIFKGKCELVQVMRLYIMNIYQKNISLIIFVSTWGSTKKICMIQSKNHLLVVFNITILQIHYSKFLSGSSRESVNLFSYKVKLGETQMRREGRARRNKLVLFTVQLQQRVNINHSSSKSWRMVHSSDGPHYSNYLNIRIVRTK